MSIYTDMAKEAYLLFKENLKSGITSTEYVRDDSVCVSEVVISSEDAARAIGKAVGRYVTIEFDDIENTTLTDISRLTDCVADELKKFIPYKKDLSVLVFGLGNRDVTPDSIGPKSCEKIFVTRHIKEYIPEILNGGSSNVCALSTGVLAETGIETFEIVKSVVDSIKPDIVFVIDALASGSICRIGRSIQISDAGIAPGSGIGNKRRAISKESLGVPVCAIGAPTVVYAGTIAENLLLCAADTYTMRKDDVEKVINILQEIEGGDLIVAPKNIDSMTDDIASVIADAVNFVCNPNMKRDDIKEFTR